MLLVLDQETTIGGTRFPAVREVTLDSGRNVPADTLTIKLPRYRDLDKDRIKVGMPVFWAGGYTASGRIAEFEGRVVGVSPREPIEIICRDAMHDATVRIMKTNFYRASLQEVLTMCAPDSATEVRVPAPQPITLRVAGRSARFALWELRRIYGYDVYYRGGFLIAESISAKAAGSMTSFTVPANKPELRGPVPDLFTKGLVIDDRVEARPPRPVRVVVKSEDPKTGIVARGMFGAGAETVTEIADGLTGQALQDRAKEIWESMQEGLTGSFVTFGIPAVEHSQAILFRDENDPTRSGPAWVDRVVKTYSPENDSYRQEIHLGRFGGDRQAVAP